MTRQEFIDYAKKHWEYEYSDKQLDIAEDAEFKCECCHATPEDSDDFFGIDELIEGECLCSECESQKDWDRQEQCAICGGDFYTPERPEDHRIFVSPELAEHQGIKPGIYQVLEYPFFIGSCLSGFDNFFKWAIELRVESSAIEGKARCAGGDVCEECWGKHAANSPNF